MLFEKIFYFYNALKAGTNESNNGHNPEKYSKSLLWQYLREEKGFNDLVWEKRMMKEDLIHDTLSDPLPSEYLYIRGLLGLTSVYEFKKTTYYDQDKKKVINKPVGMDPDYEKKPRPLTLHNPMRYIVTHDKTNKNCTKIERSLSPLTFKPVLHNGNYKVFIILKPELMKPVLGKKFKITKEKGRYDSRTKKTEWIQINGWQKEMPAITEFDLKDFSKKKTINGALLSIVLTKKPFLYFIRLYKFGSMSNSVGNF